MKYSTLFELNKTLNYFCFVIRNSTKKKQPSIAKKQLPTDFFTTVKPTTKLSSKLLQYAEPVRGNHLFKSPDARLGDNLHHQTKIGSVNYIASSSEVQDYHSLTIPKQKRQEIESVIENNSIVNMKSPTGSGAANDDFERLNSSWTENYNQINDAEFFPLQM